MKEMKAGKKRIAGLIAACLVVSLVVWPMQVAVQAKDTITAEDGKKEDSSAQLLIDNENCYDGMDKTYADGYMPRVENQTAYLVVPIVSTVPLKDQSLRVSLSLGNGEKDPFVNKNYEKTVRLQEHVVNQQAERVNSYRIAFPLELKTERYNGSYPVVLTLKATDESGTMLQQELTVYVTIRDGMDPNAEPTTEATTEAPVVYAPKLLVESCSLSKESAEAGDTVTATMKLVNESQSESIQNLSVTVSAEEEYLTLMSATDTIYVGTIPAGGSKEIAYDYEVQAAAPAGQYDLTLAFDYADSRGTPYTGSGTGKIMVTQPLHMQFDPLVISDTVQVADVIEVQLQAMNLGRSTVYNVRAELSADGLKPEGTLFIGDMEAGTKQTGTVRVDVSSLSGVQMYGKTSGTITFYYEDENGTEYQETAEFSTTIQSPFSGQAEETKDAPGQWWIIMAVIGGILIIGGLTVFLRFHRRRETVDEVVEDPVAATERK